MTKNLNILLLIFAIAGCTTTAAVRPTVTAPSASTSSMKAYQEALVAFDAGQETAAYEKLKKLLEQDRTSDISDDALLLLGRIEFRRKQYPAAYTNFKGVFEGSFSSPREAEARILAVQSLIAQNKESQAESLIQATLKIKMDVKERAYLLEAHVPLLLKKDTQIETFEALAFLAQHHPNSSSREKYKRLAQDFIDSRLTQDELKDVAEDTEAGDLRIEAMYKLAMNLVHEGKMDQAKYYFNRVSAGSPDSYLGKQAFNMLKQLDARAIVEPKTVGVVLPLTGNYVSIAEQTLKGIQMALGISGTKSAYNVRLVIEDSKGTAEDSALAVENLVLKHHVMAIIGGLSAKNVVAEATKAQDLGVPFVALSQKPDLTKIGPFIYNSSITPRLQVEHLVSYAIDKLGFKRFAVLYPNDRYGIEFANLYWDEVLRRGGTVAAAQTYTPGESDFNSHIKKMVGTYYIEDRSDEYSNLLREWKKNNKSTRKKPPETLLPPIANFDVLFVPDDLKALGQIAPMLAFNDVNTVTLIGTNLWNSPDFIKRAQTFAEKSIFVDSHLASSEKYTNSAFFKNYRDLYKDRPGSLALTGFDAGTLVMSSLKQGPRNRIEFLQALSAQKNVAGGISDLTILPDREVDRQLLPLSARKGELTVLQ